MQTEAKLFQIVIHLLSQLIGLSSTSANEDSQIKSIIGTLTQLQNNKMNPQTPGQTTVEQNPMQNLKQLSGYNFTPQIKQQMQALTGGTN